MLEERSQSNKRYIKVVSTGGFAERVDEDTPGAVKREWAVPARGNEPPKSGVTYEKLYKGLTGHIVGAAIHDGDFGTSLLVTVANDGEEVTLTMGVDSDFGQDFLKKLPNIDPEKAVYLNAWCMEDEAGKSRRGLSIKQNDEKVVDAYTTYDANTKTRTYNLGYPEPPKGTMNSDKWKLYFMNARVWLRDYTEQNNLLDKFNNASLESSDTAPQIVDDEPINLDDIPFN